MILFGASGHAKVIIDILEKQGVEVGFLVDANPEIKSLQSYRVINESEIDSYLLDQEIIISIGDNKIRKELSEQLKSEFGWAVHPSSILGDDVTIGQGTVIMAAAVVNSSTEIGNHAIINTACSIDHDCSIADYVHISPNATLCGTVTVGEGTHIGAGATIAPNLSIGEWATIGAGTVIIKDVPDRAVVVGNPGRMIRYNE
ncbi:acetyltransferase [Roseivirga sp. 4D4]|uniref:acetyltransferase n=1 Tax=Roseivirga sp. 4D4 TaxID=1889784 RepID=UPI0008528DE2|nr:acetyltransferase [Roseivirga sp. 4D4]OEK01619.1 acetyltransferase [Roseivirga sp. 4D4]